MNPTNPSRNTAPAWQSMGKILLPVNPDGGGAILSLLQETLQPLQIPAELIHRIDNSLQEVFARAVSGGIRFEHVHLFLYVPSIYDTAGGGWGFFRIERINAEADNSSHSHAVDLYLYPEGK